MATNPVGWVALGLGVMTVVLAELVTGVLRHLLKSGVSALVQTVPWDRECRRMRVAAERTRLSPGVYFDAADQGFHVFVTSDRVTLAEHNNAWVLVNEPDLPGSGIGMKCVSHGRIVGTVALDPDVFNKQWMQVNGPGGPRRRELRRCD